MQEEHISEQETLTQLLAEIRMASIEDIQAGKFDEQVMKAIDNAIAMNNAKKYKALAFAIYAGRQLSVTPLNIKLLSLFLIGMDCGVPAQIKSLEIIFQNAWDDIKKAGYYQREAVQPEPQAITFGRYTDPDQNPDSPEAYCTVIFGGGYLFAEEFLAGKHKGYALDYINNKFPGYGIYVTPIRSGYQLRAYSYALRAATRSCDIPLVFTAKIAQKFLVKTPNGGYEVGVPTENYDKLFDIKKTLFSFPSCAAKTSEQNPYGESELIHRSQISKAYPTEHCILEDFLKIEADMEQGLHHKFKMF